MKITIIGSGNLATHLSLALHAAGVEIAQVYSRSIEHAEQLACRLNCEATDALDDVNTTSDVYIISIKDDAIKHVAAQLRERRKDALIVHTAGSIPMSDLGAEGAIGVLYPMQTFSKAHDVDFKEIPCFVEASDDAAMSKIKMLAELISNKVIELSSEKRKHLHLAAVFACNMVNHCYYLSSKILENEGIDFDVMLPLIKETARKVETMSPYDAQTGPMVRNDVEVMNKQLALISDETISNVYRAIAESVKNSRA